MSRRSPSRADHAHRGARGGVAQRAFYKMIRDNRGPVRAADGEAGAGQRVAALALVGAASVMVIGVLWDISWDASIGVDSFWSPPHMAVNFGAAAAGAIAAFMVWSASRARVGAAVGVGPSRVPFDAALVLWGATAMAGWGVLDQWWAEAYGIYAERWSPPEVLFTAGAAAILAGAVVGASRAGAVAVYWSIGLALVIAVAATTQFNLPNLQRTATFHRNACAVLPLLLAWAAGYRRRGFGATMAGSSYVLLVCAMVWIFPRFAAQPLIGPIYEPVDVLIPPRFPLLLFAPALAIDAIAARVRRDTVAALALGVAFVAVFVAVQWAFSAFLLSPASDSWFFAGGGRHWPFYVEIGEERSQFWGAVEDPLGVSALLACGVLAVSGAWVGLILGRWTAELRR